MKKLNTVFSFMITILFLGLITTEAQPDFSAHPENPVVSKGIGNDWDKSSLWWPNVSFVQDTFYLTYIGTDNFPNSPLSVGLATSTDGYNFTKHPTPILQANGSDIELFSVSNGPLLKSGGSWQLYYNGISTDPSDPGRIIARANSSSPYGPWERENDTLLTVGENGEWDDAFVLPLSIIKNNDELVLYYLGGDIWPNPYGQIGMATSSDNGDTWEKYEGNPILIPGPNNFDAGSIWGASIIKKNNNWEMFYVGKRGNENLNSICYATSNDGISWTKHGIILEKSQDPIAANILESPTVIKTNSEYYLYYDYGLMQAGIGLATATSSSSILEVPFKYSTIQEGIDAAQSGDTVLVSEGNYFENINFKGKAIAVASHYILDQDTSHISKTIIDGSQSINPDTGSVVMLVSGEDTTSVLCGFTITGGTGTIVIADEVRAGGGILLNESGGKVINNIIENNHVTQNNVYCYGGGLSAGPPGSTEYVVIKNNIIRNNSVIGENFPMGGGLDIRCNGLIVNNEINNNLCKSNTSQCGGGGLITFSWGGYIRIENNVISYNKALSYSNELESGIGGGLAVVGNTGIVRNNTIEYNEVSAINSCFGPGAFFEYTDTTLTFENNRVAHNYFSNGQCNGGGICVWLGNLKVLNNNLYENSATVGGGICLNNSSFSQVISNIISNNTSSISGGGIECNNLLDAEISNNLIYNNQTQISGGGINFYQSNGIIFNNTIVENKSIIGGGGVVVDQSNPVFVNTIFYGNTARDVGGDQVFIATDNSDPTFINCDVQGGKDSFLLFEENSTYTGLYQNNIDSNPLFSVSDSLYRLTEKSPCIGAGINSVEISGIWYHCPHTDLLGGPRPHDVDEFVDIGAIESEFLLVGVEEKSEFIPTEFNLSQNYPNPFNPATQIQYSIPVAALSLHSQQTGSVEVLNVTLKVFDILGREIVTLVNQKQKPGNYEVEFDGAGLSSGIYFYRLNAGSYIETRKAILLK